MTRHWKAKATEPDRHREDDRDRYRAVYGCDPTEKLLDRHDLGPR